MIKKTTPAVKIANEKPTEKTEGIRPVNGARSNSMIWLKGLNTDANL